MIGNKSAENSYNENQSFIKRELQASLYNGQGNTKNGILGIVLPSMTNNIFKDSKICSECGGLHNIVQINDNTVIKEFSYNYYIPHNRCAWSEEDRYCVLVKWEDFCKSPELYIEKAFQKKMNLFRRKQE